MKRTLFPLAGWLVAMTAVTSALAADVISDAVRTQIEALQTEKSLRTPAQQKMDSQLIYALLRSRNQNIAPGFNALRIGVNVDGAGAVEVDIQGTVTPALLNAITAGGGKIVNSVPQFASVRATVSLALAETLAARPDVRFVRPAVKADYEAGSVTSEGDATHRADLARTVFNLDGSGIKVGVLSDSIDALPGLVASGDLPPNVTVLNGQSGNPGTSEGTAMLEIIHDLAPGAQLFFATAGGGPANFAQNILNLRAAGCDIIVDDVRYQNETPFQDGPIARAVNAVAANGAVYFASAGNSGNKLHGTSGTWEGDFVDGGAAGGPVNGRGGVVHSFGTVTYNTASAPGGSVALFWADPLGGSTNDYDLFLLDAAGTTVVASSTTAQTGTQDPFEIMPGASTGERIVVVKVSGAARFLHIDSGRGRLQLNTSGFGRGHSAATNAFATAAIDVAGTFPNPFSSNNLVEPFSSDGPRRVFFHEDGQPITPGNFLATGGAVRQYPTVAAADGVATATPGFAPFFGTSAAAPHGAAIAALVKSFDPTFTRADIWTLLTNTALDIELPGLDEVSGHGILRPYQALLAAVPQTISLAGQTLSGGNGNGVVDPNECNALEIVFRNQSSGVNTSRVAQAILFTSTPGVILTPSTFTIPSVAAGNFYTNPFPVRVTITPQFVCGTPLQFTLVVTNLFVGGVRTNQFQFASGVPQTNCGVIVTRTGKGLV